MRAGSSRVSAVERKDGIWIAVSGWPHSGSGPTERTRIADLCFRQGLARFTSKQRPDRTAGCNITLQGSPYTPLIGCLRE